MNDIAGYHVRGAVAGLTALMPTAVAGLLEVAQIVPVRLRQPEARFPEDQVLALLSAAAQHHGDPCFGLVLAQHIPLGRLELLDYLVLASPDVGTALEAMAHHAGLCASGFTYQLTRGQWADHEGVWVRLEHPLGLAALPHFVIEYLWGVLVYRIRSVCGGVFCPQLFLRQVRQQAQRSYRAVFGGVPELGEADEMFVPAEQWRLANPKCDPLLQELLSAHARDVMARLPQPGLLGAARAELAQALRLGEAGIEAVARRMGLSTRTLQRQLSAADCTYQELLDDVRRDQALRYMTHTRLSLKEISELLAYSEPSAFGRAFRRWTGNSPAAYRAKVPSAWST